jgi:uncharacterized membrane protein YkgB
MEYLKRNLPMLMRFSLAICYTWFGGLKFFEAMSPAEDLAKDTIHHLLFGIIPSPISIHLLAGWEILIGIGLFVNLFPRIVIGSAIVHMICTFTPLFFSPELCFNHPPFGFSIVGQYIMKNLVFICAFIYLYPLNQLQKNNKS